MKWETIKTAKNVKTVLWICVFIAALIFRLVKYGFSEENIMILELIAILGVAISLIVFFMNRKK